MAPHPVGDGAAVRVVMFEDPPVHTMHRGLIGIPIADQRAVRDRSDSFLRTRQGEPMRLDANSIANARSSRSTSTGAPTIRRMT